MPLPALAPAVIAAGASILGTGADVIAQGRLNKKTMEYNKEMYATQRRDSLADWTMQNDYNSPASQMQRLKDAGLNPNLVYGNGATTTADAVRSSSMPSWSPGKPDYTSGAHQAVGSYFDAQIKTLQTDNLKQQNNLIQAQTALNQANTALSLKKGARSAFDLAQADRLKDLAFDMAQHKETILDYQSQVSGINATERDQAHQYKLRQVLADTIGKELKNKLSQADIDRTTKQTALLVQQGRIAEAEANLRQYGVTFNDQLWQRIAAMGVKKLADSHSVMQKIGQAAGSIHY